MKRFFFTEKNMKKITEKYNSYQRNARLIHILPVLAKLVYAFVQIALKKKSCTEHWHADTQADRMEDDFVILSPCDLAPWAQYVFSSPLPWVLDSEQRQLVFPSVRPPVSAYPSEQTSSSDLALSGMLQPPSLSSSAGPFRVPQWPTLLHMAAQGLASGANHAFILSVLKQVCIGPC